MGRIAVNSLQKQEQDMRRKLTGRIEIRIDKEVEEALQALQDVYGKDVTRSELIRISILEKAERDKRRKDHRDQSASTS